MALLNFLRALNSLSCVRLEPRSCAASSPASFLICGTQRFHNGCETVCATVRAAQVQASHY
eukprot:10808-Heterococcus_DN1.PRE.1